jgi:adapter protein MecA 1/2
MKDVIIMKIEKLNDNQIRCTLTQADLTARQLKLSELAYGTEKARSLFRDMMQQASFDFGFEADNIPLMIEAIPTSSESVVLIITKVEDPEELDTRFSKFTPYGASEPNALDLLSKLEGAESFLDLFNKVKDVTQDSKSSTETPIKEEISLRLFSFDTIDTVIAAAQTLSLAYNGSSTLYFDNDASLYVLAMTGTNHSVSDFNKICNMLSEYGTIERASGVSLAFLEEHCKIIISDNAIQKLATL